MTIKDELLNYLSTHEFQQGGDESKSLNSFLDYFGFTNNKWPVSTDKIGNRRQNESPKIIKIINKLTMDKLDLLEISKFNDLINRVKIVRTSLLIKNIKETGLVDGSASCNIAGLLQLKRRLGYSDNLNFYDYNLQNISHKDFSALNDYVLVADSVLEKIRDGKKKASQLSSDLYFVRFSYLNDQLGDSYE